jgi:hypothetical protein
MNVVAASGIDPLGHSLHPLKGRPMVHAATAISLSLRMAAIYFLKRGDRPKINCPRGRSGEQARMRTNIIPDEAPSSSPVP